MCPSCQLPCGIQKLSPTSPSSPVHYAVRRPSVDDLFRRLRAETKIFSPSPVKAAASPGVLLGCTGGEEDQEDESADTCDSPLATTTTLSMSPASSASDPPAFASARQRGSSSHLFSKYHDPASQHQDVVWNAPHFLFLSPANFASITRTLGTILSIIGMLVVFFVLAS